MFEQATGELRATLLGNHSGISNERTHRLERARRSGGPGCGADTRHQESPQPNFARNLTRSLFKIAHKRCNSNNVNSMFEQATGELRATLLGNHSDQRGGRTHRQAAPVTSRCTRHVALHPLRRATPVTSRCTRYVAPHPLRRATPVTSRYTRSEGVHCLRIGCIAYGSGAPHNAGTHHRRVCRPARITRRQEHTKPQNQTRPAPPATTEHGLTGNTSKPTGPAHKPHPKHNEAATGFPATASSRSVSATQRSATDQAVMSTWSSTAARPASRRATGTRNGEQDT